MFIGVGCCAQTEERATLYCHPCIVCEIKNLLWDREALGIRVVAVTCIRKKLFIKVKREKLYQKWQRSIPTSSLCLIMLKCAKYFVNYIVWVENSSTFRFKCEENV